MFKEVKAVPEQFVQSNRTVLNGSNRGAQQSKKTSTLESLVLENDTSHPNRQFY